ncbi:NAD(P)/FAD-dependent oxidoreductase [Rhodococcus jostii]|uniref:NAD(P)/FAD-dependent oxidoreductase n=1 Tax=Rhodococcus jostii TaxID=132919 RepID=UPI000933AC27|nr:FAD-dependent oxidoreductase [Rhodococcus jostii]RZI53940.1 MAG: ferredoxin-NAD reductase [Pseudonocardia sp.]
MSTVRHVVVGGGVAAASAVATLRSGGFDGELVLVSDDDTVPYERPPLSKDFLEPDSPPVPTLIREPQWYVDHQVQTLLGVRAQRLDPRARRLTLSTGESLSYDGLVLATGVRARPALGDASDRILMLRSFADAKLLRSRLASAEHVAVLGGGFIGCEVAATAVGLGKRATIVERADVLMNRALGHSIGAVFTDIHRAKGVGVHLNSVVLGVHDTGSSAVVRTNHGSIEVDLVVVGAGSLPNVELAAEAGIVTDNGIVTDQFCRTNVPNVYAAGDVASSYHPFYNQHLRVEHHDTATRHGAAAARNLLGHDEPFVEAHWFWSDQYEHNLQRTGRAEGSDEVVIRGSLDDLKFSAFALRDGRIRSVISVNQPRDVIAVRRLLFVDHDVTADKLRDQAMPLNRLRSRVPASATAEERTS